LSVTDILVIELTAGEVARERPPFDTAARRRRPWTPNVSGVSGT